VFAYLTRTRLAALACGYAAGRRDPARGIRVHARRPADPADPRSPSRQGDRLVEDQPGH
jgi:hypothetical protein